MVVVSLMLSVGGSFANAIGLDLVYVLSLSTRKLPIPRYIQWMNQLSGYTEN